MADFKLGGKKGESRSGISTGVRTQLGGYLNELEHRKNVSSDGNPMQIGGLKVSK